VRSALCCADSGLGSVAGVDSIRTTANRLAKNLEINLILGDSFVTIAQWCRARHLTNLVIRKVPGSIPAENTSTQIHMDLST